MRVVGVGACQQVPSNGTLRQILESDCTPTPSADAAAAKGVGRANCTGGVVLDIGAGLPFCNSDAFASLAIRLAPDPTGGAGGQAVPVRKGSGLGVVSEPIRKFRT